MTYEDYKKQIETKWLEAQKQGNRADELFYAKVLFNLVADPGLALLNIVEERKKAHDIGFKQRYEQIIREVEACL